MRTIRSAWSAAGGGFGSERRRCVFGDGASGELVPIALSVDLELLEPLDLALGPDHPGTLVHFERSDDGRGCARDTIHSSSQGFTGTLRIHAVDDDCIVGELIDLGLPTDDLEDLSGVFVAERC